MCVTTNTGNTVVKAGPSNPGRDYALSVSFIAKYLKKNISLSFSLFLKLSASYPVQELVSDQTYANARTTPENQCSVLGPPIRNPGYLPDVSYNSIFFF